jgi:hypothetical protein
MRGVDFSDVVSGSSTTAAGNRQRLLTGTEITGFLFRHPIVAENVAQTKVLIASGLYDFDYNPNTEWRIPGTIPPWGMQVADSTYGTVTIFPRPDTFYYSGFTANLPAINKPDYQAPLGPCPDGSIDIAGVCVPKPPSLLTLGVIGLAAFVGYQTFFAKKSR